MADRYDLLSYPVRLRSGEVADDAVRVGDSAGERARNRGRKLGSALAVGLVLLGSVVFDMWGIAVVLGVVYLVVTALLVAGPSTEVVETECRAVPAGAGERVVAAHERVIARHRRRRLAGLAGVVIVTLVVASLAGPPEGIVAVGGLAVLLVYGALTTPETKRRVFAPDLVREDVSRAVAEAEAVAFVEAPFARAEAPPAPDPGEATPVEDRDDVTEPSSRQ